MLKQWLSSVFNVDSRQMRRQRRTPQYNGPEALEARLLLAADMAGVMRIGAIDGTFNEWYFDLDDSGGLPEADRLYGLATHTTAVSGDWDGDGDTDIGTVTAEGGFLRWQLDTDGDPAAELSFLYGLATDVPVTGNWDGVGGTNVGVVRQDVASGLNQWLLDTDFTPDVNLPVFEFGLLTDIPITGDWDGDGQTEVGAVRTEGGFRRWFVDYNFDSTSDETFLFGVDNGISPDQPISGDWNNDGVTDAGVTRDVGGFLHWFRDVDRDETGTPDLPEIVFGQTGDKPVSGHWSLPEIRLADGIKSGDTLDFSFGGVGAARAIQAVTIENTGNADLLLAGLQFPGGYTVSGFPDTVAPGSARSFSVELDRTVAGLQSGVLSFLTNDGNESPFEIVLNEQAPTFSVPDLAESNASDWTTFASDNAATSVADSVGYVRSGAESILFTTASGFDTGLAYPASSDAGWQLSDDHRLEFHGFAQNPNIGWQHENTFVELITANGGRIEYRPQFPLDDRYLPTDDEFFMTLSLHGDAMWERTDFNSPNLGDVDQVRFHFDTWDFGFTIRNGWRSLFCNPVGYEAYDASGGR